MAITLTERAARHVKRFLAEQGADRGLRVGIRKTGCSGYAYVVEPTVAIGERDQVFESIGIRIVIDRDSVPYLLGMELDYTREGLNETFKFRNPNVKATCGCGESFSV
ncbi:MAG: HesB/IscA family protein [Chromatiales bacterium]